MAQRGFGAWYNGVPYRSHLEVKWRIFFDTLEIPCDYETQGFLTDDSGYLPDFVVFPAGGTLWVEVKPNWEADEEGIARWRKFAAERPQPSRAVLLVGPPKVDAVYTVIGGDIDSDDPLNGPWEEDNYGWRPCPSGYHFDLAYTGTSRVTYARDKCEDDAGRGGEERIEGAIARALAHRIGKRGPDGDH